MRSAVPPWQIGSRRFQHQVSRIALPTGVQIDRDARYLDRNLIEVSPAANVNAVRQEMVRLGWIAHGMLQDCRKVLIGGELKMIPETLLIEKTINELTHDIVVYATELGQKRLSADLSLLLNFCISGVGDIERIGDHAENLIEMVQLIMEKKRSFLNKAFVECEEMFGLVTQALEKSLRALESEDIALAQEAMALEPKIDQMEHLLRARHIEWLNTGKCHPVAGVVFIDILSNLERVGDHAHNVAYIVRDIERIHKKERSKKQ